MKNTNRSFYKSILKATSAFGIFQLLRIIIRLFVGKISAIFLGPGGMGLIGLIENTLNLISSITGFGLTISGVRQVALDDDGTDKLDETVSLLNKLALYTGFLGALTVVFFSPFLSWFIFGTYQKYYWFFILSLYFIFFSISSINNTILQGKRKLKLLLVSNFIVTVLTAILSYILYASFKESAIIPVFIVTSFLSMIVSIYTLKKVFKNTVTISFKEMIEKSRPLIKMGMLLSVNVIFGQVCYYLIRFYLKEQDSSILILGFYEVSNVFLVSYLGLVFAAMGNDYYPKLTSFSGDKDSFNKLVNEQIQVALLIVTPIILFFYVFKEFIIQKLYTVEFLPVIEILTIGLFAIVLKAIMWPLGFIPLALNDNREYFRQNIAGDILNVILTVILYNFLGLKGIGLAVVINFTLFVLYLSILSIRKYKFTYELSTIWIGIVSIIFGLLAILMSMYSNQMILIFLLIISVILTSIMFYKKIRSPK
jgi:O-antigen/teichoic acid export membrane protein